MDMDRKSISGICLKISAWISITYTIFTILGILIWKLYTVSSVQKEISAAKGKLVEIQLHLKGLGVTWLDIDVELVEKIFHSIVWFIFVLGMMWLLLNLYMAGQLLLGVAKGDLKRLKKWIIFGLFVLTLDILFYPLQFAICAHEKNIIGPICDPSNNIWLDILLNIIFYSSILVAHIHRQELQEQLKQVKRMEIKLTTFKETRDEEEFVHVKELLDMDLKENHEVTSTAN